MLITRFPPYITSASLGWRGLPALHSKYVGAHGHGTHCHSYYCRRVNESEATSCDTQLMTGVVGRVI